MAAHFCPSHPCPICESNRTHTSLFIKSPKHEIVENTLDDTVSIWIKRNELGVEIKLSANEFVMFTRELKSQINADPDLKAIWKRSKGS